MDRSETIKWLIEDQVFSPSCDLALPPPTPVSNLDGRHTGRLRKRDNLMTGELGKGTMEEPNHMTARKPGPL